MSSPSSVQGEEEVKEPKLIVAITDTTFTLDDEITYLFDDYDFKIVTKYEDYKDRDYILVTHRNGKLKYHDNLLPNETHIKPDINNLNSLDVIRSKSLLPNIKILKEYVTYKPMFLVMIDTNPDASEYIFCCNADGYNQLECFQMKNYLFELFYDRDVPKIRIHYTPGLIKITDTIIEEGSVITTNIFLYENDDTIYENLDSSSRHNLYVIKEIFKSYSSRIPSVKKSPSPSEEGPIRRIVYKSKGSPGSFVKLSPSPEDQDIPAGYDEYKIAKDLLNLLTEMDFKGNPEQIRKTMEQFKDIIKSCTELVQLSKDLDNSVQPYIAIWDTLLRIFNKNESIAKYTGETWAKKYQRAYRHFLMAVDIFKENIRLLPGIIKNKKVLYILLETVLSTLKDTENLQTDVMVKKKDELIDIIRVIYRNQQHKYDSDNQENATFRLRNGIRSFGNSLFGKQENNPNFLMDIPKKYTVRNMPSGVAMESDDAIEKQNMRRELFMALIHANEFPVTFAPIIELNLSTIHSKVRNIEFYLGRQEVLHKRPINTRFIAFYLASIDLELIEKKFPSGHANIILLDQSLKTIERFESQLDLPDDPFEFDDNDKSVGLTRESFNSALIEMDNVLSQFIPYTYNMNYNMTGEKIIFEYFTPNHFVTCNLQLDDMLCSMWPFVYLIHRLQYPDMSRRSVVNRISKELKTDPIYIHRFSAYMGTALQIILDRFGGEHEDIGKQHNLVVTVFK